jgi:exopolysaccharide biosynthesis polyprenyl glycosylphosphotransferase
MIMENNNQIINAVFQPDALRHIYQVDSRTARMLEFYAEERFDTLWERQRRFLLLLLWLVRTRLHRRTKRMLDLVLVCIGLVLVVPIMVITALAIKLESPGPVLFKQTRVGKWGRLFTCYKFRSMYIDAEAHLADLQAQNEADGPVFKIKNDPRVTRVGRIIRRLSIDELPQLFNVLRGDMSLVGPRPALPDEVVQYSCDQARRLQAIPGLTGLQQVSGRSDISFTQWIELDLEYIWQQSLLQDIVIILKTIPVILLGKGAY